MKFHLFFYLCFLILLDASEGFSTKVNPGSNRAHLDNGAVAEYISETIYKKNGYSMIDAEVGRSGVDGLFVKRAGDGEIKEVIFSEVKYGSSNLGSIKNGSIQQMSKEWKLKKLDEKIASFPQTKLSAKQKKELKELKKIKKMVASDSQKVKSHLTRIQNHENGKFSILINELEQKGSNRVKVGKQLRHGWQDNIIDINARHYKVGSQRWKIQKAMKHAVRKQKRLLKEKKRLDELIEVQKKYRKESKRYKNYAKSIKKQKSLIEKIKKSRPSFMKKGSKVTSSMEAVADKRMLKTIGAIPVPSIVKRSGKKVLVFMDASIIKKSPKLKKLKFASKIKGGDVVMMAFEGGVAVYSVLNGSMSYKMLSRMLLKRAGQEAAEQAFTKGIALLAPPPSNVAIALTIAGGMLIDYSIEKYEELDRRKYVGIEDMLWDVPDSIKNKITIYDNDGKGRSSIFDVENGNQSIFDDPEDKENIFDHETKNDTIFD